MTKTKRALQTLLTLAMLLAATRAGAQTVNLARPAASGEEHGRLYRAFMIGLNLGELPWQGSFKLGVTLGYHINEHAYVGVMYQIPDHIKRDGSSINAGAVGLAGLSSSSESVGHRLLVETRLRPHRYAPYVTLGVVLNAADTETISFDDRTRDIAGQSYSGRITIKQTRPLGIRPAIGLGYGYTFDFGLSLNVQWSGWVFAKAPAPEIEIDSPTLDAKARRFLEQRITDKFQKSPFNLYHVFALGVGYVF
ncbi:MAG: hypothetical protein KC503_19690 [Myxococcales bacterium]|nr:hypothetical protein [Myxococcales bacterium]